MIFPSILVRVLDMISLAGQRGNEYTVLYITVYQLNSTVYLGWSH